jgi:hypothetical protein
VTIHLCLIVYQQGVLEMLWDSFVLCWGYWELQIINYCLQFINVLHCVIYITSCHIDTECGKFVGFTPQSFAQWRRWRVKLTIELNGARLMVSQLLKKIPILIEFEVSFPCSQNPPPAVHTTIFTRSTSFQSYLSSILISRFIKNLIFKRDIFLSVLQKNFMCICYLFHEGVLNTQPINLFMIAI